MTAVGDRRYRKKSEEVRMNWMSSQLHFFLFFFFLLVAVKEMSAKIIVGTQDISTGSQSD